jgi:hypothetical protein
MAGIPHRGDSLRHRHFLACHFPALRQLLPRHEVMVMHTHFWFVCAARSATQVSVPADRASSLLSRADLPAGKRAVANYIEDHVADCSWYPRSDRPFEPISLQPGIQARIRHGSAPLPHASSHRARQVAAGRVLGDGHFGGNSCGVLGDEFVLDGLSTSDGRNAVQLPDSCSLRRKPWDHERNMTQIASMTVNLMQA